MPKRRPAVLRERVDHSKPPITKHELGQLLSCARIGIKCLAGFGVMTLEVLMDKRGIATADPSLPKILVEAFADNPTQGAGIQDVPCQRSEPDEVSDRLVHLLALLARRAQPVA